MLRRTVALALLTLAVAGRALPQDNRIDIVTPLAPDLAAFGPHVVGVRTITVAFPGRPDVLRTQEGGPTAVADRVLVLEVWYPASLAAGQVPGCEYATTSRDPAVPITLRGRAVRDAAPLPASTPFPLVILSRGYPGNRYLMSHLGEHLASRGFVVVAIDHPGSTYADQKGFASTLYHRPFDLLFVIGEIDRLSREDPRS
jgi:hypothetical protein